MTNNTTIPQKTLWACALSIALTLLGMASVSAAELTISTYYPAPFGLYQKLQLTPRADLSGACTVGSLYVKSDGQLQVCSDQGDVGAWGLLAELWTQENDTIYLSDKSNPDLRVGIGTATPEFKLTLVDEAGLLAKGTYGAGESVPDLPAGPKFIWNPRKASLRAGYTSGDQWDDANIGNYSFGFGYYDQAPVAQGAYSFIGGGKNNIASGDYSFVGGGELNAAIGSHSAVFSGKGNEVYGDYSVIMGGFFNQNIGHYSFLGGGHQNLIQSDYSVIGGGGENLIVSTSPYSVIIGGFQNEINNSSCVPCDSCGPTGSAIVCAAGASGIGGGFQNTVTHNHSVIVGGDRNTVNSPYSNIVGGSQNTVAEMCSGIVGGKSNSVTSPYSVIVGGDTNSVSGPYSNIVGGGNNSVSGSYSTVVGGKSNAVSGDYSIVSGGENNSVASDYSWIPGGKNMQLTAAANNSFLWGYSDLPVQVATPYSFIIAPGQDTNGFFAYQPRVGFRDITPAGILEINGTALSGMTKIFAVTSSSAATAGDVFVLDNSSPNRIGVGVAAPASTNRMEWSVALANGAKLTSGGVWQDMPSRREYKENISLLSADQAQQTLADLNPVSFFYKKMPEEQQLGFIAEDVPDLVAMKDRKSLSAMEILAVLSRVVQEQDRMIEEQQKEIRDIQQRIHALKVRTP